MIYNITEIKVGDEILFHSTPTQSNHDEYWIVNGIQGSLITIELTKNGLNEYWTIDIKDVVAHISMS